MNEASENISDASSFKQEVDWSKYKIVIEDLLEKRFPNNKGTKSKVLIKRDRLNFSCPYCGDSHKNERKKRANIYFKSSKFKCYNSDECPRPNLRNFLKDFDSLGKISLEEISTLIDLEKSYVPAKFNVGFGTQIIEDSLLTNFGLKLTDVVNKLNLMPISPWIQQYLENRLQKVTDRFYMDSRMCLWIFNTIGEYVLGAQVRSFKLNDPNKYITYRLNKLYDMLDIDIPDVEDFEMLDEVSTFFGWFTVDTDKPIIVFEGPLDHFLFNNSIAQCSLSVHIDTNIGEFKFLYDNDEPGRKSLIKKANEGYSVFLWNKFIKDYNLPPKIKDFNDVLIELKKQNKGYPLNIMDYFSTSKYDLYDL